MPPKPTRPKPLGSYIETETGNKVSRRAQLHGTQHIFLTGRAVISHHVCIRGDLFSTTTSTTSTSSHPPSTSTTTTTDAKTNTQPITYATSVSIGRYTYLSPYAVLRPPHHISPDGGTVTYTPLKIGDHVFIGAGSVVEASSVGDHVVVGKGCVVGRMAVLKDGCKVLDGCVVPAGMVVASGCVVGGRPGRVVGEVGDGWGMYEGMEGGDMRGLWRGVGGVGG